eukprot:2924949-Ditylum_brightwellii.AAC.1
MSADPPWSLRKVVFSLLPLAGTFFLPSNSERYNHNQIQGMVNVNIPVHQTVIKLSEVAGSG